jgi:hypothetical protein
MLQLAEDTDSLSIVVVEPNPLGNGIVTRKPFGTWAAAGTQCASASDQLACIHTLAETRSALNDEYTRSGKPCGKRVRAFGMATRGDRVIALRCPRSAPQPNRDVVAIETSRAGCVRELFGAMVAHVQCERAGDPALRDAFAAIAHDEAAPAFDLHRYVLTRLSPAQQAALAERRGARGLRHALARGGPRVVGRVCLRIRLSCGADTSARGA